MNNDATSTRSTVPWLPVRLLIIEDNTTVAMCVSAQLIRYGCEVHHAGSGEQALHDLERCSYGLIFMDIGLPDGNGFDLAKKIRALSNTAIANTPIIALTGHQSEREHCLEVGMQDVLLKPANSEQLVSMIQKYAVMKASTVTDEDTGIIDWGTCVDMCGGIEDDAKEIIALCATDLNKTLAILNKAYDARDKQGLCDELHRVSGGVCYLKLPDLEEALHDFHRTVKTKIDDTEAMSSTYGHLKQAIMRFQTECAERGFIET